MLGLKLNHVSKKKPRCQRSCSPLVKVIDGRVDGIWWIVFTPITCYVIYSSTCYLSRVMFSYYQYAPSYWCCLHVYMVYCQTLQKNIFTISYRVFLENKKHLEMSPQYVKNRKIAHAFFIIHNLHCVCLFQFTWIIERLYSYVSTLNLYDVIMCPNEVYWFCSQFWIVFNWTRTKHLLTILHDIIVSTNAYGPFDTLRITKELMESRQM